MSRVDFKLSEKVQYQVYKDGLRRQQRAPVHHAQCHRCQRDRQGYTLPLLYFFQPFPLAIENYRNLDSICLVFQCSMQVGDERRATRGMEDLDFHIGDEAMNVGNPYAVKVRQEYSS